MELGLGCATSGKREFVERPQLVQRCEGEEKVGARRRERSNRGSKPVFTIPPVRTCFLSAQIFSYRPRRSKKGDFVSDRGPLSDLWLSGAAKWANSTLLSASLRLLISPLLIWAVILIPTYVTARISLPDALLSSCTLGALCLDNLVNFSN